MIFHVYLSYKHTTTDDRDGETPQECEWDWADCDVTCGGGVQSSVVTWKDERDDDCDPPKQRECNVQPCN